MNRDPLRSITTFLALLLPGLLAVALFGAPAHALTKQEKMETCKFGAADQKLTGAKQKAFIARCMANEPAPGKGKKKKEEKKS